MLAALSRLVHRSTPSRPHTLAEMLGEFRTRFVATQPNPRGYECPLRVLTRHLGAIPLSQVTPKAIEDFRVARLAEGVSRPSVNRNVSCLSRVMRCAVDWGYLEANPCRRIKQYPENPGRSRFLSAGEVASMLACIRSDMRLLILCALHTAGRRGELLRLTWADCDLDRRMIRFARTKNHESRFVPMTETLYREMTAIPLSKRHGRLFPFTLSAVRRGFEAGCKAAGVSDATLHDTRRTAASFLLAAGVPLEEIRLIGGWKSYQMVQRYARMRPEQLRSAVSVLDKAVAWTGPHEVK